MPFRCKQKFHAAPFMSVSSLEMKTLETGEVLFQSEDLCSAKMPDPELFDLKTQLKAGVNLEEVSSRVMRPRRISVSLESSPDINNPQLVKDNDEN